MAIRPLCGILATPIINYYIVRVGVEKTILTGSLLYSISFILFSLVVYCDKQSMFLTTSYSTQIGVGVAYSALVIGEHCILLRYSPKEDREKNTALFRVALGVGSMLGPVIGSLMFTIGEFIGVFSSVGLVYLVITPFIFFRLN